MPLSLSLDRRASDASANIESVPRNVTHVIVAIVLLTCFVCPLVELFDQWDHTLQTGNDTEYTLVLFALCIGIVFTLIRLSIALFSNVFVLSTSTVLRLRLRRSPFFCFAGALLLASATGSPPLNLRI